jgi:hypothetical protein
MIKKTETKLEKEVEKIEAKAEKKPELTKLNVIKTLVYERCNEIEKIDYKYHKITGWLTAGDTVYVNDELAKDLLGKNIAVKVDE